MKGNENIKYLKHYEENNAHRNSMCMSQIGQIWHIIHNGPRTNLEICAMFWICLLVITTQDILHLQYWHSLTQSCALFLVDVTHCVNCTFYSHKQWL